MKIKSLTKLGTWVAAVILSGLASCSSGVSEEKLEGNWKGEDFQFVQSEGPNVVAMIDGGRELHEQSELLLKADGTYEIVVKEDIPNGEGVWRVIDGNLLQTISGSDTILYEVMDLSENRLVTKHQVAYETPMGNLAGEITLIYKR